MNRKIVGVMGFKGSGKDSVAKILCEYDFTAVSFASTVKDVLSVIFGWDRVMLEGITSEHRAQRETVDVWWAEKLGVPDFTPRKAMTMVGTDLFREHFCDKIWVYALHNKVNKINGNVVVTDIRFKNEHQYVSELGAKTFRVDRFEYDWEPIGILASRGDPEAIDGMKSLNIHSSEWDWLSVQWDDRIDNTSSLSNLAKEVEQKILLHP